MEAREKALEEIKIKIVRENMLKSKCESCVNSIGLNYEMKGGLSISLLEEAGK